MEVLFYIAIAVIAAFLLLYVFVRPRWWRIAWCISAILAAGLSAPYLIERTADESRFVVFIALATLIIAGIAPIAERKS